MAYFPVTEANLNELIVTVAADLNAEGIDTSRYNVDALVAAHADYDDNTATVDLTQVYLDLHNYRRPILGIHAQRVAIA